MESKGLILCTEDDPDSCAMLRMLLEKSGFEVICPGDTTDALEIARTQKIDLFLLDNWTDGLTGIELTKSIRAAGISTPILFYSGVAEETDLKEAFDAGAQAYLIKPDGVADLVNEIDRLIHQAKTEPQHATSN